MDYDTLIPDNELTPAPQKRGMYKRPLRTRCKHGHELTSENVKVAIDGRRKVRRCAVCQRASRRKYNAKYNAKHKKLSIRAAMISLLQDFVAEERDYDELIQQARDILEAAAQQPPGRKTKPVRT